MSDCLFRYIGICIYHYCIVYKLQFHISILKYTLGMNITTYIPQECRLWSVKYDKESRENKLPTHL